jgi:prevent-host-death family protein
MNIPITEAKAVLTDLVRRAEAGEEIVLTRHGRPAVQLKPLAHKSPQPTREQKEAQYKAIMEISRRASAAIAPGPDAAHSADYLYGENGLPT